ncbi:fimbrial biogenesis outer membrane usher protein [Enterobacter hormaechei]|nr:fimbrial biogenesis outer membrane usher protein [Enterobacter hormaechei]HBC0589354.1 fimbrial biogenesis outer membrane usher protein [Enterobacter cloacae]
MAVSLPDVKANEKAISERGDGQKSGVIDSPVKFDDDFLRMSDGKLAEHVNLDYFAHRGGMMPGDYQVQVKVNDKVVEDSRAITFRSWPNFPGKLYACVSAGMLAEWGVKVSKTVVSNDDKKSALDELAASKEVAIAPIVVSKNDVDSTCPVGGVATMVKWGKEKFDYSRRLLSITVPQAALGPQSMMRTSPTRWDEGITAFLINYNYSGSQQNSNVTGHSGSDYLGLNGQLNILGWRVRSGLNWYNSQGKGQEWNTQDVYAQHDYSYLGGGQFSVGRLTSDGSVVDSIPFVGMKMESDNGMLDPTYTSHQPAITGIANSAATVTVREYGKVVYQENVPQGPFSLTDFNRSGNADVDVEIRESDGSSRHFTMSSVVAPSLMSRGALKYSVSTGKYRNGNRYVSPEFAQGNLSYGVGENKSLLMGAIASKDYLALSSGVGGYSPLLGALSLTGTFSSANLESVSKANGRVSGFSGEFNWSRNIAGAVLGFAATRYASRNFHSFSDVQLMDPKNISEDNNQRATYIINLSRSFGDFGSLSLSGNQTSYWSGGKVQRGYTLSYGTSIHYVGVNVTAGYNSYRGSRRDDTHSDSNDKSIALNITLPLSRWLAGSGGVTNGTYMYTNYGGKINQQAGVSGSLLGGRANYSVSQGWRDSDSRNASISYSARYADFNGGYNTWGSQHNFNYGMSGGLLFHPHGVTFSKQLDLDGANALIEIPDVNGVRVGNGETDWRGYTVVSGLTPFELNRMNVDASSLPGNVELDSTSKNLVPTRGAVVRVKFAGLQGYRILFEISRATGGVIPFGSVVSLESKDGASNTGIVGDNGQTYMSGLPDKGQLLVQWAEGNNNRCKADYQIPEGTDVHKLSQLTAVCI